MRLSSLLLGISFLLPTSGVRADENAKPALLSEKEIADGWLLLFDGETTFGWTGKAEVKDGVMQIPKGESIAYKVALPVGEVIFEAADCNVGVRSASTSAKEESHTETSAGWRNITIKRSQTGNKVDTSISSKTVGESWQSNRSEAGDNAVSTWSFDLIAGKNGGQVKPIKFRPTTKVKLFNGKDLSGWKVFAGDPKRVATKFDVTKDGELRAVNGPGDLQTEKTFDNFLLQIECKTNGIALNSGIFFRCLPEQYQSGYEMQIQNAIVGDDRTKPLDFGTGAIYRRIAARKVVSNDKEWFAMSLLAHGAQFATWVNGYPVVSWTDDRKPDDNARKGMKLGKGHLSIQGHDPTTDLLFRNMRIVELDAAKRE